MSAMENSLRLSALGVAFDLELCASAPAPYRAAIDHAWSRCLDAGEAAAGTRVIEPLIAPTPADDSDEAIRAAMQRLSQQVTRHLIAAQTGRLLMLHAAALCDPATGASLVFVAPGGTGKTTLARRLGRHHGYLTDETVGIDPETGHIHPYPKPLSIIAGEGRRKVETSPDDLGLLSPPPSSILARLVLLRREPERPAPPRLEDLSVPDAVMALLPETSAITRLARPLHLLADLLERTHGALRLTYREAHDLVDLVAQLIGDRP